MTNFNLLVCRVRRKEQASFLRSIAVLRVQAYAEKEFNFFSVDAAPHARSKQLIFPSWFLVWINKFFNTSFFRWYYFTKDKSKVIVFYYYLILGANSCRSAYKAFSEGCKDIENLIHNDILFLQIYQIPPAPS
jgi:hypothetical protein